MQLLTFTLGGNDFGIPLKDIELVEGRSNDIVKLPAESSYVKGFVTIRGDIAVIYSLALRFGYNEEKLRYFIIVNVEGMRLGIEADMVNSVIDTDETEAEVLSVPSLLGERDNYLKNIVTASQKQLIILLDVHSLIPHEEKEEIRRLITS